MNDKNVNVEIDNGKYSLENRITLGGADLGGEDFWDVVIILMNDFGKDLELKSL